jgi:hypothetical protein
MIRKGVLEDGALIFETARPAANAAPVLIKAA